MAIVKNERMVVTPEMAREWLRRSRAWSKEHPDDSNRPPKDVTIKHIAADIMAGLWEVHGKSFHIGAPWAGNLLDGQNRAMAVDLAGLAVESYVAFDDSETCPRKIRVDDNSTPRRENWGAGIDGKTWAAATMITQIAQMKSGTCISGVPRGDIATMARVSRSIALLSMPATARRGLTATPVRVGVVLSAYMANGNRGEIVDQYKGFIKDSAEDLWPIVRNFRNQITTASATRRQIGREELPARSFKTFSAVGPARSLTRVQISDLEFVLAGASNAAQMFVKDAS